MSIAQLERKSITSVDSLSFPPASCPASGSSQASGAPAGLRGVGAPAGAGASASDGRESPLGIMANITDPPSNGEWLERELVAWRRNRLWRLHRASARLFREGRDRELQAAGVDLASLPVEDRGYHRVCRCKWCMRSEFVEVNYSPGRKKAYYTNLVTCGSWSADPVCGSRIASARAVELGAGVKSGRGRGMVIPHLTFTLAHSSGDSLEVLVARLNAAFSSLKTRGRYKKHLLREFGVDGPGRGGELKQRLYCVRAFECTWGYNGFHPHLHVLFFLAPGSDWQAFGEEVRRLWYLEVGGVLQASGAPADSNLWKHCLEVTCSDAEVADYLAKWGHDPSWDLPQELALAVRKSGRDTGHSKHYTMAGLLSSYLDTGNEQHGRLWYEFGSVMFRKNLLTWSDGLREYLGLGEELSDSQVAEEGEEDHVVLAQLAGDLWELVRGGSDYRAALLAAADCGSRDLVMGWLDTLRRTGAPPVGLPVGSGGDLAGYRHGLVDS